MAEETSHHEVEVLCEPQVTSKDSNERKLARKLRIERRWETIRRANMAETKESVEETNKPIQQQVQKSMELLEKYVLEAEEYITNVRVANESREVDRRENEGIGREKVIAQLEADAETAQNMFKEIADKWSTIQKYNDPLNIHDDIAIQKDKCNLLMKQKDAVIAMLRDELKTAEKKFTKDQQKQMEDINKLAQRIEKQVTLMRKAYQREFDLIEEVICADRQNLIDSDNKKWEELATKREQQEISNSDTKFKQLDDFNHKVMELRIDFQEKFRETKIKLENDIEHLQRELERIKALALLNSEKLDYNYQILRKREDENLIIKSQQKRRINKLQDVINDLRNNIDEYESSTNNRIKKLTENIKKLHQNILEVEAKADRFATINDEKFHQIWKINENTCQAILKKILATDKILYEQQMGIVWEPPAHNITQKKHLPSYKEAVKLLGNVPSSSSMKSSKYKKGNDSDFDINKSEPPEQLDRNPVYRRLLKYILTHVSDKSGFLTEKKLKLLLKPYEDDEKTWVRLDNVFESLGIEKPSDIDLLVNFFIPYSHCPTCAGYDCTADSMISRFTSQISHISSAMNRVDEDTMEIVELDQALNAIQQHEQVIESVVLELVTSETYLDDKDFVLENSLEEVCGGAVLDQYYTDMKEKKMIKKKAAITDERIICRFNHPLIISTVYIHVALRDFVAAYYKKNEGLPTTRERLEKRRYTVSRLLNDKDIITFWEKYREVYDEERIRVWEGLLEGLKSYHEILKDRKILCEEVVDLRKQNEELKRLLANYIDHGEYMSPSCAVQNESCLTTFTPPYTKNK